MLQRLMKDKGRKIRNWRVPDRDQGLYDSKSLVLN